MVLSLISVVYLVCDFGKVKLDVYYFEIFYDQKKNQKTKIRLHLQCRGHRRRVFDPWVRNIL